MADLNAGILAPVSDEFVGTDLRVSGRIPPDLCGTLLRNGPNPHGGRFEGDDMLSWWVAPAMLHGVAIADGAAKWYRNSWVRTGDWARHFEPETDVEADRNHNPNVNVIRHAGRTLALGEGGLPFEVAGDLTTIGPVTFGETLPGGMTAHPKIDPTTGELVYFRADWQAPFLRYGVLDCMGVATTSQVIELAEPAMMHDFAITERHSIFLDLNVGYDFSMLQHGAAIPLRWSDDRQSRLGVVPRGGGDVRWFEIENCFVQHVLNAYEPGDDDTGADDDGWLLTCVYRAASDTTDVVILDAADVAAEPVATIHLPRRVPAGFHGTWIGA